MASIHFFPMSQNEAINKLEPAHVQAECGHCGKATNARVLAATSRTDGTLIRWCICACEREEPMIMLIPGGKSVDDKEWLPSARLFTSNSKWPHEIAQLYEEASTAFAAGAFTACSMMARKALMNCACREGDADGRTFQQYVDYIVGTVLTYPKAKTAIDQIRKIGNDANHNIAFVSQADAKRAMEILTYMLNTIYSLPSA